MKDLTEYQDKKIDKAEYAYSQTADQQLQINVQHMYELRKTRMLVNIMKSNKYTQNAKLMMCWLIANDANEFKASHVYDALGFKKAHWLNFVKPQLVEMNWIRPINKTHYEFLNPMFLDIY